MHRIDELVHHQQKLTGALVIPDAAAVTEHAADIGNICMKAIEMFGTFAPAVPVQGEGELPAQEMPYEGSPLERKDLLAKIESLSRELLDTRENTVIVRMDQYAELTAPQAAYTLYQLWQDALHKPYAAHPENAELVAAQERIRELENALQKIRDAATNWHCFHDHEGSPVQCDAICACLPECDAALRTYADAKGEGNPKSSALPSNEEFTLLYDDEGHFVIRAHRDHMKQHLSAHGDTANEAVERMCWFIQNADEMQAERKDSQR